MKFPYGNSNFEKIITNEYLYIDRTDRIPLIENAGESILFLRPRRFGKSLLVSMLENYYDIAKSDDFERLFGHLVIGQNPTSLRNQFMVMKWDFSFVTISGSEDGIEQSLNQYINERIRNFAIRYSNFLTIDIPVHPENAIVSYMALLTAVQESGHKLYLFIDEYDNFANEVLMSGPTTNPERYQTLVTGEGIFKTFFKSVKGSMAGMGLDRAFMTGVSPIVMSDVTSGYNIATNLSWKPKLNALCGFTEDDVRPLADKVAAECQLPESKSAEAMALMRTFYNGSRFSPNVDELVYNPTQVFYFLREWQETCIYPEQLLDSNLAPDYQKLVYISEHSDGEEILLSALNEDEVLSVTEVGERFGIREMLALDKRRDRMASLLCHLGVLTLDGRTDDGGYKLRIPNLVIESLYVQRILELMLPSHQQQSGQDAAKALYVNGNMQPLCEFFAQNHLTIFDNRDYHGANELTFKTLFLALLFNDRTYIMDSEPALQRTYADLTMIVRPEMRRFSLLDILIEFKYVAPSTMKLSGEEAREKSDEELKGLNLVATAITDAEKQVQGYAAKLHAKYGELLGLRSYVVVAVGFERLVWQEVAAP